MGIRLLNNHKGKINFKRSIDEEREILNRVKGKMEGREDIEEDKELYKNIIDALCLFKENYEVEDFKIPKKIRNILINKNILFLNPQKGTVKPQSYLIWNAIKKVI